MLTRVLRQHTVYCVLRQHACATSAHTVLCATSAHSVHVLALSLARATHTHTLTFSYSLARSLTHSLSPPPPLSLTQLIFISHLQFHVRTPLKNQKKKNPPPLPIQGTLHHKTAKYVYSPIPPPPPTRSICFFFSKHLRASICLFFF